MQRKFLCFTLALLLCVSLAVPALAIGNNAMPSGGGYIERSMTDMWDISGVVAKGYTDSWENLDNGDYTCTVKIDPTTGYPETVYYTKSPTTATLVLSEHEDEENSSVTVRKLKYENNTIIHPDGYWEQKPIEPTSGKLSSYENDEYDPPATFWQYSIGSVVTLEKGVYIFSTQGARADALYVVVGYDPPAAVVHDLTPIPNASKVLVDGKSVEFDAYTIDGYNYFKLRDLAYTLNGSPKNFNVEWDGGKNQIVLTPHTPYKIAGGEMETKAAPGKTAVPATADLYYNVEGPIPNFGFTAYAIDGYTYYKLRDVAYAVGFGVDWDGEKNTIVIDTSKGYTY
ncbi:MAG: copper amine oxidase N-terminal domain-containing protein [Oscillospiraceae bacterium]|jgi:hypothetical protein|nr:copper amine oxidase N-terminal domain-containing protein [Oscillospiraceae bacterium]